MKTTDSTSANQINYLLPTGAIIMWSGAESAIPLGWAICDGKPVPGTSLTTPDLRSRFIVGVGPGNQSLYEENKLSSYVLGQTGGKEKHTLVIDEMPKHSHSYTLNIDLSSIPGIHAIGDGQNAEPYSLNTDSAGGSKPHENMPPYYALYFIMKT